MSQDQVLVSQTKFETLLERIAREKQTLKTSQLNQKHFRDIAKSIASAYFYMRSVLGMPERDVTIEEIELVHAELQKQADAFLKSRPYRSFRLLGYGWTWRYYRKHGFFGINRTPFGRWYWSHPWHASTWDSFVAPTKEAYSTTRSIPPNFRELADVMLETTIKKNEAAK